MSKKEEKKNNEENLNEEQLKEEDISKEAEAAENSEPQEAPEEKTSEENKQTEDLQTQYLRLAADFQNYRRRTENTRSEAYQDARIEIVSKLLEVIDNFERAMDAAPADDKFAEGMALILKQLLDLLKSNNVEEIEALGKPFDPNFHNAVMTEDAEGTESGTITKVFQKGYILNSKVIRPAMVIVAK